MAAFNASRVFALTLLLAAGLTTGLPGCSAELGGAADEADPTGEGLEGLTADDAEARAAKLLAEADAKGTDFEPAENRTRAVPAEGVAPAGLPLGGGAVGMRTLTDDAKAGLGQGTWGFRFVVTKIGGAAGEPTRRVLSEGNTTSKLLGASSFKLFTGWTAVKSGPTKVNTLTLMLRNAAGRCSCRQHAPVPPESPNTTPSSCRTSRPFSKSTADSSCPSANSTNGSASR